MPKNTSVILGDRFEAFIGEQVDEGRYASASEVIRAGLRLLEVENAKLVALRAALKDGEASGFVEDFDVDAFLATKRAAT